MILYIYIYIRKGLVSASVLVMRRCAPSSPPNTTTNPTTLITINRLPAIPQFSFIKNQNNEYLFVQICWNLKHFYGDQVEPNNLHNIQNIIYRCHVGNIWIPNWRLICNIHSALHTLNSTFSKIWCGMNR